MIYPCVLTHWDWGKIFAVGIFKWSFLSETVWISIGNSLKFVPNDPINSKAALVQVTAWWRTGDTPLSEPTMTQINDSYMRHLKLTHWGRMTLICVGKLTIIGSDNGLSPERRQAIIWTNNGILLIGPLGTNFSEILVEIQTFSSKKIRLKMSSAKCYSFRLGLNVLRRDSSQTHHKRWWEQD